MKVKCPSNWYILECDERGDPVWYRRKCHRYEARRVKSMDGLRTEALYLAEHGPAVSLGEFSSMPAAMSECRAHLDQLNLKGRL